MVSEKEHRTTTRRTIVTGAMGVKPFADNFFGKFSLLTNVCKLLFQSQLFWQLIVVDYILEILPIIMTYKLLANFANCSYRLVFELSA